MEELLCVLGSSEEDGTRIPFHTPIARMRQLRKLWVSPHLYHRGRLRNGSSSPTIYMWSSLDKQSFKTAYNFYKFWWLG